MQWLDITQNVFRQLARRTANILVRLDRFCPADITGILRESANSASFIGLER